MPAVLLIVVIKAMARPIDNYLVTERCAKPWLESKGKTGDARDFGPGVGQAQRNSDQPPALSVAMTESSLMARV